MKDPKARLVDMDSEGIEVAVLFGGGIGGTIPRLKMLPLQPNWPVPAIPGWRNIARPIPARLKGTAVLPQQDTAAAVAEPHAP